MTTGKAALSVFHQILFCWRTPEDLARAQLGRATETALVHAHVAAAALITVTFAKLFNPGAESGKPVKGYIQEQPEAITTSAVVADASEVAFVKHYGTIMPLLLNVLRNANDLSHHKLQVKAIECAGLVVMAVGCDVFRPDARTLIDALINI
ncbi:hypothetical protein OG21DRAFT_1491046 [Imleria badia]|nr:hypothetical protein OG21DRAFT_1491046 [Imleria badia]